MPGVFFALERLSIPARKLAEIAPNLCLTVDVRFRCVVDDARGQLHSTTKSSRTSFHVGQRFGTLSLRDRVARWKHEVLRSEHG